MTFDMNPNEKIISFDLESEMGFFKKPDINDGIYLTYNMLHKPALLGILGAIIGLKGYEKNEILPEYYVMLHHLKIGIQPLNSNNGDYLKEIIGYNNSTGMGMNNSNLQVKEQVLINPAYRCYLLLNMDNQLEKLLFDNIMSYSAEYIPYMGKNEFSAWWSNVKQYDKPLEFKFDRKYKISSLFQKEEAVSGYIARSFSLFSKKSEEPSFVYFEKLPIGFDCEHYQYEYGDFVYSNMTFSADMKFTSKKLFYDLGQDGIIQMI